MGELLPVAGEFTGKDGEELVEDGLGERERILAFDDSAHRLIAPPARQGEAAWRGTARPGGEDLLHPPVRHVFLLHSYGTLILPKTHP